MSAAIIARNPPEFVPQLAFAPVLLGGTVTNSSAGFEALNFKKVSNSGASFNYSASQVVPNFKEDWVITSDTPAICTVAGNTITRVANGLGRVRATGPHGISVVADLNFTTTASDSYVWTGFTNNTSKSWLLSNPILSLLNVSKDVNYYTATYPLSVSPATTFPRNTNCWAASLDLSGSAIATGLGGDRTTANSVALITPRHWVGVRHWGSGAGNMGVGSNLYFADAAGNVYTRTVLARHIEPSMDLIVCLLSSALPAGVKPLKLAGNSFFDFTKKIAYGIGWKIDQTKGVSLAIFDHVSSPQAPSRGVSITSLSWLDFADSGPFQITDPDHVLYPFRKFLYAAIVGDSGGAIGGYYNGEVYLTALFTSPLGGQFLSENQAPFLNSIIASLDASQGISTGYTVGILNI